MLICFLAVTGLQLVGEPDDEVRPPLAPRSPSMRRAGFTTAAAEPDRIA